MRNVNIFRTHVTDHIIPSEVMRRAIVLSPGRDWADPKTEAYQFLKRWALEQDKRYPPKENPFKGVVSADGVKAEDMETVIYFESVAIPESVMDQAKLLGSINDKRTKAYKYLKNWIKDND